MLNLHNYIKMKNIILIFGLVLISILSFGQRKYWTEKLALSGGGDTLTGTDTIIWADANEHYFGEPATFEVKFHLLTADDATIGLVVADNDSLWHYISPSFPVTLDRTLYGYTNQYGDTVSSVLFITGELYYKKVGVRFSKGTCTGELSWYLYQH